MKNRRLQLSVGAVISIVLLVLLLRVVDTGAVAAAVALADGRLIVVAVGVYLLAMFVRSVLWRRLLLARATTATLLQVVIVGFAVSYLMPLRVGELARAYLLKQWCGIEYGTTLASLVAERVLDGLCVGGLLLVSLLFVPAPSYVLVLGLVVAGLFSGLAAALMVASWRAETVIALVTALAGHLPRRMHAIVGLTRGFVRGLEPLRNWRALPGLVTLCLVGWLCQFAVFYILMLAFHLPAVSMPLALLEGGVANFATLLPSAPGFVGTFDAAVIKLLTDVQGVTVNTAAAYTVVLHTVLVVPIVVLGALILWRANLSLSHVLGRSLRLKPAAVTAAATAAMSPSGIVV